MINFFDKTRMVYRLCSQDEVAYLINGDVESLGSFAPATSQHPNNHKYKNEKYLHFFSSKEDALSVLPELQANKAYLCSFEMQNSFLSKYRGCGYYAPHGYDADYTYIKEYAIPVSQFDINSFCGFVSIADLYQQNEKGEDSVMTDNIYNHESTLPLQNAPEK